MVYHTERHTLRALTAEVQHNEPLSITLYPLDHLLECGRPVNYPVEQNIATQACFKGGERLSFLPFLAQFRDLVNPLHRREIFQSSRLARRRSVLYIQINQGTHKPEHQHEHEHIDTFKLLEDGATRVSMRDLHVHRVDELDDSKQSNRDTPHLPAVGPFLIMKLGLGYVDIVERIDCYGVLGGEEEVGGRVLSWGWGQSI
jgi:hypothetical protein